MEIKRKMIKRFLEFSKTKDYFFDHIQSECSLGKMIAKNIILERGFFFIFLPIKANLSKLYQFAEGGINPLIPTEESYLLEDQTFTPNKRITTFKECSIFIQEFLNEDKNHVAIFEDAIRTKNNSHVLLNGVKLHFLNNQVYYLLDQNNTIDQIYSVLRKTDSVWHSLTVLAKTDKFPTELSEDDLLNICKNIKYIITTSHDSENCVFWLRS